MGSLLSSWLLAHLVMGSRRFACCRWQPPLHKGKRGQGGSALRTGTWLARPAALPSEDTGHVPALDRGSWPACSSWSGFGRLSSDSSNCPGCGGSVFDLAVRGRSVGKRVGELVDNPQGYPSGRPRVCPHGAAAGGIVLAPGAAAASMSNVTNRCARTGGDRWRRTTAYLL